MSTQESLYRIQVEGEIRVRASSVEEAVERGFDDLYNASREDLLMFLESLLVAQDGVSIVADSEA